MDINKRDIAVLCESDEAQEIAWLQVDQNNKGITFKNSYQVPATAIVQNPYEIAIYSVGNVVTILLHDKDLNGDSKDSTVKVLHI